MEVAGIAAILLGIAEILKAVAKVIDSIKAKDHRRK